ncbi:hypothetical protein M413DRAFT_438472 [Hebeloma cylindrosporum]|uniref:Geranylgeranyl transferase type-2 subunit alpha n=1 Tax=Hebeloma cylindrosporum TaxID=76867 RepID=A0A0C2YHM3_HEBCY|nr:hypothetical protein M413DRAFT_438472 [Hebeloma cylindrosporum h7]
MHGVKRQSNQTRDDLKRKEQSKIEKYLKLSEAVLSRRKAKDWSQDAFNLTTTLLQFNPEFYTIWNYRRIILANGIFANSPPALINDVLSDDLAMTMSALKAHPKVYWIWNHRRWCLENLPNGPGQEGDADFLGWKQNSWDKELVIVELMLSADPRNFHAWDYRRFILASMPIAREEEDKLELQFTYKKITANFSNFSAWHQRSKTLRKLWEANNLNEAKSRAEELENAREAFFTDPDDQSVWIYHRWLVGTDPSKELLEREIASIQELVKEEPDKKWCLESIVHYKLLLLRNYGRELDAKVLSEECRVLLRCLQTLDPARRRRYEDLELDL